MELLLGIDAGTTSFKSVLFDTNGEEIASVIYEYDLNHPGADMVELEAELYWEACKIVIRSVVSKWKGKVSDIKALAIASQGETLIPVNRRGEPLRPAIVWLDNRAVDEAEMIKTEFNLDNTFNITGQPDIVPTWPACKIMWLKKHEPDVFKQTYKFLLLEDYLIYKLTGKFIAEGSLLSSTLYFDIHIGSWWTNMIRYLGISEDRLPEIKSSGQIIAEITDNAVIETGLAKDTLVVTGALDQAASTIGAGNANFGVITENTGSALAICANISQPIFDPERRIPCHFHAIPDTYFLLPWCQTAGMVYKWFRNEFYNINKNNCDFIASTTYKKMDEDAAQISPGSDGLIMLPHLAGAFTPESNPHARAVFFGISLQTRRAHLTRAILESVAFMLKRNIKLVEELGIAVHEIHSIGGGSKSVLWNQIKADICQKPLVTVHTSETTSLGSAMLAGVALNIFDDIKQAVVKMSRLGQKIEPDSDKSAVYSTAYEKYIKLYNALESLF